MEKFASTDLDRDNTIGLFFTAPWCGVCKMIHPAMDKKASQYAGVVDFREVNVEDNKDMAMQYAVTALPTLILVKNGKVTNRIVGGPIASFTPDTK